MAALRIQNNRAARWRGSAERRISKGAERLRLAPALNLRYAAPGSDRVSPICRRHPRNCNATGQPSISMLALARAYSEKACILLVGKPSR